VTTQPLLFVAASLLQIKHNFIAGYEVSVYGRQLLKATASTVLAWLFSIILVCGVAGFLTYLGKTMSFYSQPMLALCLYLPPAIVGILVVHSCAGRFLFKVKRLLRYFLFKIPN